MCCGQAFWKRIIAFCVAFGLGVFVAGLFTLRAATVEFCPIGKTQPPSENKNCVPIDESLKYETLKGNTPISPYKLEEATKPKAKKPEDGKKSLKIEIEKQNKSAEPQFYDGSKNPAEFKNLLHRERCFETAAQ